MARSQFTFYRSFYEAVTELPKKDQVSVILAICEYALNGKDVELKGVPKAVFSLIKPNLDASKRRAEAGQRGGKTEANCKQSGSKQQANCKQTVSKTEANCKQSGSEKEGEIEKEIENEIEIEIENECYIGATPPVRRFVAPTLDDVSAYCRERGNNVDPAAFLDHYTANGWMVGKTHMKDWKATVRNWERTRMDPPPVSKVTPPKKGMTSCTNADVLDYI